MPTLMPYKHDCEKCIWVSWIKVGDRWGNMYYCPECSKQGSVIIRFSDEVDDYWSSPVGALSKGSLGLPDLM